MHCKRYEPDKKVKSADGQRTLDVVDTVEATALSPDATTVATAGWTGHEERVRGRAEIWDATTGERLRTDSRTAEILCTEWSTALIQNGY